MISKNITINIPTDMEARPVALLVQVASQFESNIYVEVEDKKVNAKSIMGMMTLSIAPGEEVTIITKGVDEEEAMNKIEEYLTTSKYTYFIIKIDRKEAVVKPVLKHSSIVRVLVLQQSFFVS